MNNAILLTNVDTPRSGDSENRLQESRGIRAQNTDSLVPAVFQVICQTTCTVRKLAVAFAKNLIVGSDMVDRFRLCNCQ